MADLDLTEAVAAAARGWFESAPDAPSHDDMPAMVKHRARETVLPGIVAAAPLIAAQALAPIEALADVLDAEMDEALAYAKAHRPKPQEPQP